MGLKKNDSTATAPVQGAAPAVTAPAAASSTENGTAAAVSRLKKTTETTAAKSSVAPKARDYDAEARGKTRCVQFEAALMSPAIAGMKFDTMEQYLALCKQAAEFGTAYTFGD